MKRLMKYGSMTLSVFALSLLLFVGAAASQPVEPVASDEPAVSAMPQPQPMDYRSAGALMAAAIGGAGMTWAAKRYGGAKGPKNYMLSGFFSFVSGAGVAKMTGLPWRDAVIMSAMGGLSGQATYKAAKHRAPSN